jgi:hypothetical protein
LTKWVNLVVLAFWAVEVSLLRVPEIVMRVSLIVRQAHRQNGKILPLRAVNVNALVLGVHSGLIPKRLMAMDGVFLRVEVTRVLTAMIDAETAARQQLHKQLARILLQTADGIIALHCVLIKERKAVLIVVCSALTKMPAISH